MGARKRTQGDIESRHLAQLNRRKDFLKTRMERYRPDGNPSFDKAEHDAIEWALAQIKEHRECRSTPATAST